MKRTFLAAIALMMGVTAFAQQPTFPRSQAEDTKGYMSKEYWAIWNAEEQARIDADIERYRKSDAEITLPNIAKNSDVKIEQISHHFIFGQNLYTGSSHYLPLPASIA